MSDHTSNETRIVEAESVAIERAESSDLGSVASAAVAMMQANPTPETAERVLAFLERLEAGQARRAFARDMISLKAELPPVLARNAKGHTGRYASLDSILTAVTPILTRHGFTANWDPHSDEKMVTVTLELLHVAGHSRRSTMSAPPDTGPGRNAVQARGSTVAYLQRYLLPSMLGVTTGDAPDPGDAPVEQPDTVDPKRNNAMVTALRRRGRSMAEAVAIAGGRTAAQWTAADREEIGLWLKGAPAAAAAGPTPEELAADERRMAEER